MKVFTSSSMVHSKTHALEDHIDRFNKIQEVLEVLMFEENSTAFDEVIKVRNEVAATIVLILMSGMWTVNRNAGVWEGNSHD